jgi:16S rRNA (adenine1518-N6/adenine1519-N6)-dimethyltransferase
MTLNQIKHALESRHIQLTKSLGQNFLHDANQLRRILEAADVGSGDRILEIGPGLGALTQLLLDRTPHVLAIEKDQRLYDVLRTRWSEHAELQLLHADALDYLRDNQSRDWSDWKLVSNLPYSVASPILVELSKVAAPPARLVVTVQLEVAERLVAAPGRKDYGVLTLLVQLRYAPAGMFKIPASSFFPAPDIDSACLTLVRRPNALLEPSQFRAFEKIVKRGFSQRRKMMLKLLKADWPTPKLEHTFAELNISAQARAETVSLPQYMELTKRLTNDTQI